jgi:hypothetical protein
LVCFTKKNLATICSWCMTKRPLWPDTYFLLKSFHKYQEYLTPETCQQKINKKSTFINMCVTSVHAHFLAGSCFYYLNQKSRAHKGLDYWLSPQARPQAPAQFY